MNINLEKFDEKLEQDLKKLGFRKAENSAFRYSISLALEHKSAVVKWTLYNGVSTLGFAILEREYKDYNFNDYMKIINHYTALLTLIRKCLDNFE